MADDYTRQEWDRIQYIRNKTNKLNNILYILLNKNI